MTFRVKKDSTRTPSNQNFVSNTKTMDILFKMFSHLKYLYVQSVQILYHIFMRRLIIWMFNTDLSHIMI